MIPGTITIQVTPVNPHSVSLDITSQIMEDSLRAALDGIVNRKGWDIKIERTPFPPEAKA